MFAYLINIQIVTDTHIIIYVETGTGSVYFHNSAMKHVICLSTSLSLCLVTVFLKICTLDFSDFFAYVNLKKLAEPNFFGKIRFCSKFARKAPKLRLFRLIEKYCHFDFLEILLNESFRNT